MHQVGLETEAGEPIARELRALDDVEDAKGDAPGLSPLHQTVMGRQVQSSKGQQKITWGGQVREKLLHLSPNEYQQKQN